MTYDGWTETYIFLLNLKQIPLVWFSLLIIATKILHFSPIQTEEDHVITHGL